VQPFLRFIPTRLGFELLDELALPFSGAARMLLILVGLGSVRHAWLPMGWV